MLLDVLIVVVNRLTVVAKPGLGFTAPDLFDQSLLQHRRQIHPGGPGWQSRSSLTDRLMGRLGAEVSHGELMRIAYAHTSAQSTGSGPLRVPQSALGCKSLPLVLSIASSRLDTPRPSGLVACGEFRLTGEVAVQSNSNSNRPWPSKLSKIGVAKWPFRIESPLAAKLSLAGNRGGRWSGRPRGRDRWDAQVHSHPGANSSGTPGDPRHLHF